MATHRAPLDLRLLTLGANQAVACARLLGRLWHLKFMSLAKGKQGWHLQLAMLFVLMALLEKFELY